MTDDPTTGEVWWVDLEPALGSEANKVRPSIVFGSTDFDAIPLRLVIPCTTWQGRFIEHPNKFRIRATSENGLDVDSAADGLQMRSVSLMRFRLRVGKLGATDMDGVRNVVTLVTVSSTGA